MHAAGESLVASRLWFGLIFFFSGFRHLGALKQKTPRLVHTGVGGKQDQRGSDITPKSKTHLDFRGGKPQRVLRGRKERRDRNRAREREQNVR